MKPNYQVFPGTTTNKTRQGAGGFIKLHTGLFMVDEIIVTGINGSDLTEVPENDYYKSIADTR